MCFAAMMLRQCELPYHGDALPLSFDVAHIDLYFFYDIDIAILVVEIAGEKFRCGRRLIPCTAFGRPYPTHWEPSGRGGHCRGAVRVALA